MKNQLAQKVTIVITLLVILILLFRTCENSKDHQGKNPKIDPSSIHTMVPDGATFLFVFNLENILNELDFDSLRLTAAYKERLTSSYQSNPPFTQVVANPVGCGIDVQEKAIFYIDVGDHLDDVHSVAMFSLANLSYFEMMVEKEMKQKPTQMGLYSFLEIDERSGVAWSDKMAVFITSEESLNKKTKLKSIFETTELKYLNNNSGFNSWVSSINEDVGFWLDMDSYANNQIFPKYQGRAEMDQKYLENINYTGTVDFKTGGIEISMTPVWNKLLGSYFDKITSSKSKDKLFDHVPGIDISFFASVSFDLDELVRLFLKDVKTKIAMREKLRHYGLVIEDIKDILTGDLGFISYSNKNSNKLSTLVVGGLKVPEQFNKLLDVAAELGSVQQEEENLYILPNEVIPFFPIVANYPDRKLRLLVKNEKAYITGDKKLIDYILADDKDPETVDSPLNFYDNGQANHLMGYYRSGASDSADAYRDKFGLQSVNFSFDGSTFQIHIKSVGQKTSSIKQLLSIN